MKILGYLINDIPLESRVYNAGDLSGNKPFRISWNDVIDNGYGDISTIGNWHEFGSACNVDYKVVREAVKAIAVTDWLTLSVVEKKIAAEYFTVDKDKQLEVYNESQLMDLGIKYHMASCATRNVRGKIAAAYMYYNMSQDTVFELVHNMYVDKYVSWGLEGIYSGDCESGIFDYINSYAGSDWDGAGLKESGIEITSELTIDELIEGIMDILTGRI